MSLTYETIVIAERVSINTFQVTVFTTLYEALKSQLARGDMDMQVTWQLWCCSGCKKNICSFMMTSSNSNIFRVTGPLCGESNGDRWIPHTKFSDAELWCFIDLRLNKRLSKQSWCWWFETPSCSLWRHCNVCCVVLMASIRWRRRRRLVCSGTAWSHGNRLLGSVAPVQWRCDTSHLTTRSVSWSSAPGPTTRTRYAGLILGLCPANERRRYFVTTSLIGWVQAKHQPWAWWDEGMDK